MLEALLKRITDDAEYHWFEWPNEAAEGLVTWLNTRFAAWISHTPVYRPLHQISRPLLKEESRSAYDE